MVSSMLKLFKPKPKSNRYEKPDPKPSKVLSGLNRAPSTAEMVRAAVRQEMSMVAEANEMETFEEANDFDVDGDSFANSPFEIEDDEMFKGNSTGFIEEKPAPPEEDSEKPASEDPPAVEEP